MANEPLGSVLHHVRKLAAARQTDPRSDRELLERFVADQDEAAFAELVKRHSSMVLNLCRRVLRHAHDAEDAWQVTFLVLARKAVSIRKKDSVASWLHGVAQRVAANLHRDVARRGAREGPAVDVPEADTTEAVARRDVQVALDGELARLPEHYRAPLVLCYLEGKTRDEAALELGWSLGTLRGRLERGCDLLRARLTRRGLTLSATLLTLVLTEQALSAAVSIARMAATAKAATLLARGQALTPGLISAQVAAWTQGVLRTMVLTKTKTAALALLALAVLAAGGLLAYQTFGRGRQGDEPSRPEAKAPAKEAPAGEDPMAGSKKVESLTLPGPAVAVAFSPDGKVLASANETDRTFPALHLWETATGKEIRGIAQLPHEQVTAVAFSPKDDVLAAAIAEKIIILWDTATWKEVRRIDAPRVEITSLAFAPDGKTLAATGNVPAGVPAKVVLWDAATGQKVREFQRDIDSWLWAVAFSPDGKTLAAGGGPVKDPADPLRGEHPVFRWQTDTGKELPRLTGHRDAIASVAFAPDGRTLVSASQAQDETVRLWDLDAAKERVRIGPFNAQCVLFTRDGKTLIGGGPEKVICLWDAATGKERGRLEGHGGWVNALAVTPDGKTLASAGQDNTVRFWDLAGGALLPRESDLGPEVKGLRAKVTLSQEKFQVGSAALRDGKPDASSVPWIDWRRAEDLPPPAILLRQER